MNKYSRQISWVGIVLFLSGIGLGFQNCGKGFQSQQMSSLGSLETQKDYAEPEVKFAVEPMANLRTQNVSFPLLTIVDERLRVKSLSCQVDELPAVDCSQGQFNAMNLSEGDHLFVVRLVDSSGQIAQELRRVLRIDVTAPSLVVNSAPPTRTKSDAAEILFSGADSVSGIGTYECSIGNSSNFRACTSPLTLSNLLEGAQSIFVRALDRAGNSSVVREISWAIDKTAPSVLITTRPPANDRSASARFEFNSQETGASFECQLDQGAPAVCQSPFEVSALAQGQHRFTVVVKDDLSNTSQIYYDWIVDTTPPTAPIVTAQSGSATNVATASISFVSQDTNGSGVVSYKCKVDSLSEEICVSPLAVTVTAEGDHRLEVKAIDGAGNESAFSSVAWKYDITAPLLQITSSPKAFTERTTANFAFSAQETGSGFQEFLCGLDSQALAVCSSPLVFQDLPEGNHTLRITARDRAGNSSSTTSQWTIVRPVPPPNSLDQVTKLAVGGERSCSVHQSGAVKCWGYNAYGNLGVGVSEGFTALNPTTVSGITSPRVLSTGLNHTCAVAGNGDVFCWGENTSGQLGLGTGSRVAVPSLVSGVSGAIDVAAGNSHTCAVLSTGRVKCWGSNRYGQLGNGATNNNPVLSPVDVLSINNAESVSVGEYSSCAKLVGGTVKCWGYDLTGPLALLTSPSNITVPTLVPGMTNVRTVLVNARNICALNTSGQIICKSNSGVSSVSGVSQVTSFSAGQYHFCAVEDSGNVKCWGANTNGALGNGQTIDSTVPVDVANVVTAREVSAGYNHSCALLQNGNVQCWGGNFWGQLGNGSLSRLSQPSVPVGLENTAEIKVAGDYSCARSNTGAIKCWGYNRNLNFNISQPNDFPVPTDFPSISNVLSMSTSFGKLWLLGQDKKVRCYGLSCRAGLPIENLEMVLTFSGSDTHACAVVQGGTVKCWGDNSTGQLGVDPTTVSTSFFAAIQVPNVANASNVVVGRNFSCALSTDGTVKCWGHNGNGQLGLGVPLNPQPNFYPPSLVVGVTNVVEISGNDLTMCATQANGSTYCWGLDTLVIGSRTDRTNPENETYLQGLRNISLSVGLICGIDGNQSVVCRGFNFNGQLGNGLVGQSGVQTHRIPNLSGAVSVATGSNHACALLSDSSVKCWGDNSRGAVGSDPDLFRPKFVRQQNL